MLALRLVHEARPEVPIHLFGERTGWSQFPIVEYGTLEPHAIARLYAGSAVGLALSMTDVSLTPMEMLAAGLPCVVNDSPWVRSDLADAPVTYAAPTPDALAEALLHHLDQPLDDVRRNELRQSMRSRTWEHTLGVVADRLEMLAR
jgi:glycosyltransferase involved in cell wall biosynthesis